MQFCLKTSFGVREPYPGLISPPVLPWKQQRLVLGLSWLFRYLKHKSSSLVFRILRGSNEVMGRKGLSSKWSLNNLGCLSGLMELAKRKVCSVWEVTALSDYIPYEENRAVVSEISQNRGSASHGCTYWASNGATFRGRKENDHCWGGGLEGCPRMNADLQTCKKRPSTDRPRSTKLQILSRD